MIRQYINEKGLRIIKETNNNSGLQALMECPKCGEKEFWINLDSGAYQCWRKKNCGIQGNFADFKIMLGDDPFMSREKVYSTPQTKPKPINDKVIGWFKNRGISEGTVKHFKIGLAPEGNEMMYPYLKDGKLTDIKYRLFNEKKFRREKNCKSVLWNQDNIKGNRLYILEGEPDCMAFYEYGFEGTSMPSGTNDLGWIEHDWDYLENFKEIYLILDEDTAGRNAVKEIVKRLGEHKCYNVRLPFKDMNECLLKGITKEQITEYIDNAEGFKLDELKHCDSYTEEVIEQNENYNKLDGIITGDIDLTKALKGWREGELTIWTGSNGSGKSTRLSQEIISLLEQQLKIGVGSFEMKPKRYLYWLVKQALGFTEKKIEDYHIEKILNGYAEKLFCIDVRGVIEKDYLFKIIQFGYFKYGIKHWIIDSLMCVELTSNQQMILGEQKKFVNELKDLAERYGLHIHLVAHPRKGKDDEQVIGKSDVSGTGAITDLADNVIIMHRYTEAQKEKRKSDGKDVFDAAMMLKKNREHGIETNIYYYFDTRCKLFKKEPIVYFDNNTDF